MDGHKRALFSRTFGEYATSQGIELGNIMKNTARLATVS